MKYFVKDQGKIYGPIDEAKIMTAVSDNFFSFNCMLSVDRQDWRLFQQVMPEAARLVVVPISVKVPDKCAAASGRRQPDAANNPVANAAPGSGSGSVQTPPPLENNSGKSRKSSPRPIWAVVGTVIVLISCVIACFCMFASCDTEPGEGDFRQACQKYQSAVGLVTVVFEDSDGKPLTGKIGNFNLQSEHPVGTAFAIGPDQFVTNCHVAYGVKAQKGGFIDLWLYSLVVEAAKKDGVRTKSELRKYIQRHKKEIQEAADELKKRVRIRKVEIRLAHSNGKALTVTGVQIHPRYNNNASGEEEYRNGEFDVAILHTSEKTDVYFKLADKETLYSLAAGRRIAYMGFPMEGLEDSGNLDINNPEAIFKDGSINKITDFRNVHSKPEFNRSIIHDIPAAGGASGSPIFLANGKVVAVLWGVSHSGANSKGRVASAVQHNMAVRIDVLDAVRGEEVYRVKDWTGENNK